MVIPEFPCFFFLSVLCLLDLYRGFFLSIIYKRAPKRRLRDVSLLRRGAKPLRKREEGCSSYLQELTSFSERFTAPGSEVIVTQFPIGFILPFPIWTISWVHVTVANTTSAEVCVHYGHGELLLTHADVRATNECYFLGQQNNADLRPQYFRAHVLLQNVVSFYFRTL